MGIWIDTDMGGDDLFAILLAMRAKVVDGISLSFGNAPLPQVRANAAGAAQAFGWRVPVHAGADRSILGAVTTAQYALGSTGIPTRGAELPATEADHGDALPALTDWLAGEAEAEILALGPLTNLAILALARPDLLHRIGRITWMGGAIGRGNHTASAEFNAAADPEAIAILLARNVPITMVDLDACRRVEIVEADVTNTNCSALLRDLLGGYLDIALSRGRPAMALYDPVAAALLAAPELFTTAPAEVTVELAGALTRGRTIVDQRAPQRANARIVQDLDAAAVKALCLSALEDHP
ncbi:nucleoside hydrolase [Aliiruegeria sabulilitoris]|uniref:nucleoside hydrolase n=1 Tax=Aliiruegeria sabulilitoris TaxID=1510458 RepID=UPI0008353E7F|nr:nucleoside hydrolase [Aliiruegeria sabulilitoris]NDR58473.1 nucleoside hydrolase [Pseudoruegeria sp. M32A2M]